MKKLIALLLTTISSNAFAVNCNPCDPCPDICPSPPRSVSAYNAPYSIDLQCQWDLFLSGSFLWLEAKEENLNLGTIITQQGGAAFTVPAGIDRRVVEFEFEYKPGFQVGVGLNFDLDNWQLYAEYTYLHQNINTSIDPLTSQTIKGGVTTRQQIAPDWFPLQPSLYAFSEGSGTWELDLDLAELQLARDYYVGQYLTFRSYGAIEALWIRQRLDVNFSGPQNAASPKNTITTTSTLKTKSWGVGPKIGVDLKWLSCTSFRLFANTSGSLIFTKYTTISQSGSTVLTHASNPSESFTFSDQTGFRNSPCFIRPIAEITLGFGWGSYICTDKWYFDLEAGYTTLVFWNQNMFVVNTFDTTFQHYPSEVRGGDLSLNGLVLKARIDF